MKNQNSSSFKKQNGNEILIGVGIGVGVGILAFFLTKPKPQPTKTQPTKTQPTKINPMTVKQFVETTRNAAIQTSEKYGLNVYVTLAQSALETGWGKSAPNNMYFGMKAGPSWKGEKQFLWTKEFIGGSYISTQRWFRAYARPEDSFDDYGRLLSSKNWFKNAINYKNDTERYIAEIQKGGYATDPNYVSKILKVVELIKKTNLV